MRLSGLIIVLHRVHLDVSHLILACRNLAKGEDAKKRITASSASWKTPEIEVWPLDLADYSSVIAFGDRACTTLTRLDAVVLNAGVELIDFSLTEGIETTLTVNVVSTFLLAYLILPKLRKTAKMKSQDTHLTFVGSMIHIMAKTEQLRNAKQGEMFKMLSDPAQADMVGRYNLSKLILTLAHRDFVARVDKKYSQNSSRVIINDVNPAWCGTDLFRHKDQSTGEKVAFRLMGRTGEVGGRTLTHAASAGKETHGKYVSECIVKSESQFVRSKTGQQVQDKLGGELRDLLEKIRPGVTQLS